MSLCKTCGARIVWCRTDTGKRIPVDPEPCRDGNLVLVSGDLLPTVRSVGRAEYKPGQALYQAHFASCPERKTRRKKPPGPVVFTEPLFEEGEAP